jgi:hypothetical protein
MEVKILSLPHNTNIQEEPRITQGNNDAVYMQIFLYYKMLCKKWLHYIMYIQKS